MKNKLILSFAIMLMSGNVLSEYRIIINNNMIKIPEPSLINFNQHTFTTCGSTGHSGPTLSQCSEEYSGKDVDATDNKQFSMNGGIQYWTIPETALYKIDAYGAKGGSNTTTAETGGNGIHTSGEFNLQKGTQISVLVGQKGVGYSRNSGGGGGTFVVNNVSNAGVSDILIVAGGGGGGGNSGGNGRNGQLTESGGFGYPGYSPGTNGYGSDYSRTGGWGQSGAGFRGDGNGRGTQNYDSGTVALSYLNGGIGAKNVNGDNASTGSCQASPGGFGGGGSGACNGGGGAGGYSGGGSGGGGGGTKNNGLNPQTTISSGTVQGKVIITKI